MFELIDDILINSDWHLNHKNIWIYEFEKRQIFINKEKYSNINSKKDLENFYNKNELEWNKDLNTKFYLDTEYNMLLRIKKDLKNILQNYTIKEYINLGDFLFNISENKIQEYTKTKNYELVLEIFNIFKKKNINTTLFLGNHDNPKFVTFYYNFFNNIKEYEYNNGILLSHYPFNKDNIFFQKIKNIDYIENNIKLSIHWHTHNNIPKELKDERYKHIKYVNMSIEKFI